MLLPRYPVITFVLLVVLILCACRPVTQTAPAAQPASAPVVTTKARPAVAAKAPKLVAVENGQAIFSASGYYTKWCVDWINIYRQDNGTWKNVDETLPSGPYYILGGKLENNEDSYPVLRAVPLSGEVKVTIDLYGDNMCWSKSTFEFIVDQ
jgi:hypothetical protein